MPFGAAVRRGPVRPDRARHLRLLHAAPAAAARHRTLRARGRRVDCVARLGRHRAGRLGHRAARDAHRRARFRPVLVQAFLAIEDRRFYEHAGLDFRGILRAALANLRAGEVAQGGSTITQQVARSFFDRDLFFSRSLFRKIPEAILARRHRGPLQRSRTSSPSISTRSSSGRPPTASPPPPAATSTRPSIELDLGEMATIAGIARAPSRFAPTANLAARPDAGATRCWPPWPPPATSAPRTRTAGAAAPLVLRQPPDFFRERSPYFAEHVRRDIARRYGEKMLYEGGLEIETTVVPWIDCAAQENVDFSLRKLDKRQGWRGPVARLNGPERRAVPAPGGGTLRQPAAGRGAALPGPGRVERRPAPACASGRSSLLSALGQHALGVALQLQGLDQRQDHPEYDQRACAPGDVIWVANAHSHQPAALLRLGVRQQERAALAAGLPGPLAARAASRSCGWSRSRACRARSSATTTTPATWWRWWAATTTTAPSSTASPRPAASPARPTSRSTTRWRCRRTTATSRCSTTSPAPRSTRSRARCGYPPT